MRSDMEQRVKDTLVVHATGTVNTLRSNVG
jgi:hypothetical protein